ncbi:MAG: prepilin-type N-terminal cleavage/methylation domain-containing protein [Gammaproteobacteria bacterium]|nr:prepilin-type N-terminal cleavage/methylation domain-containing protein [Gammaproteobacteria bacterium]MBT8056601.1 prepilin-type N-terminal cleavage/methylation domain-containing protein [Gammaproteobacteria bacterium]NNJ79726.1 prepilin-type N-terminal cleavage/methylation domain-containing protein [Xanthomonadales bacterium]
MKSPSLIRMNVTPKKGRGFSLLEVIVAVAICSSGFGGLSLLLMLAIQETAASRFQTLAVNQAESMNQLILVLPNAASGTFSPSPTPACLLGGVCTPGVMLSAAVHAWRRDLGNDLPGGDGVACRDSTPEDGTAEAPGCDGLGSVVVKVFWEEPGKGEAAAPVSQRVVSRLPLL